MKRMFVIKGMKCAACQAHVNRAVTAVGCVKTAEVNLLTGILTAELDDSPDGPQQVVDAVNKSGFKAIPVPEDKPYVLPADETPALRRRFLVSFVFLLVMLAVGFMPITPAEQGRAADTCILVKMLIQFVLTIWIILVNRDCFKSGFARLVRFSPDMNTLIAIGASMAVLFSPIILLGMISEYIDVYFFGNVHAGSTTSIARLGHDLYFHSAAMILTIVDFGKFLEARAKRRTTDAISKLIRLVPKTATIVRKGTEAEIPASALMPGDTVLVRPGAAVPADGVITEGTGLLDESAITGESVPVGRESGERVIGGTVNQSGSFRFRVEHAGKDTTLAAIIQLVENAANSKAPISRLADKVSLFFVPAVILIAIGTGVIWAGNGYPAGYCMQMAVCVLVASCPCALGLATPVAIMVATGVGSKFGILIRNAAALETLSKVRTIALDKTGTLTAGSHRVVHAHGMCAYTDQQRQDLLARIAALEARSEHPFGRAITDYAANQGAAFAAIAVRDFVSLPGFGVSGVSGDLALVCGNARMMEKCGISCDEMTRAEVHESARGCSAMYVADADGKKLLFVFLLADTVREDAAPAVELFRKHKLTTVLLTGDSRAAADVVADELGIPEVHAEMEPAAKAEFVRALRLSSRHPVAMLGDGINDAAALASADVGIAIGSGTDIALETADVVLAKNSLTDAVTAIRLSRATMRTIRGNLFWAFFYNVLCIPFAAGVFQPVYTAMHNSSSAFLHDIAAALYPVLVEHPPALFAAAMACSSLFVVTNALQLRKFRPGTDRQGAAS